MMRLLNNSKFHEPVGTLLDERCLGLDRLECKIESAATPKLRKAAAVVLYSLIQI
ncbi:MAG: hypothetical protein ACLPX5_11615 [Dissulfurispiraceae bacterium]